MTLDEALEQARNKLDRSFELMNGLEGKGDLLDKLVASYVLLAMEHHHAMIILIENHRRISVAALVRPQFEAIVRGTWLAFKGDGVIASEIGAGLHKWKGIRKMCTQIDTFIEGKTFTEIVDTNIDALHSYTHGGTHMLSRCMNDNDIISSFTDNEMIEILSATSVNMLMMILAFAVKADHEYLKKGIRAEIVG